MPGADKERNMQQTAVEKALDNVRPALEADGFDLRLQQIVGDGDVEIVLEAKPDACHDCLVPDEMLVQIIETAIRDEDPSIQRVTLTKVGFEGPPQH
jgi:Fe-S cluster biogenesis protein NfuA